MTTKRIGTAAIVCLTLAAAANAQTTNPGAVYDSPEGWSAPRTEWGDPDLRGMWPLDLGQTPLQRPADLGDKAYLTDAEYEEAVAEATAEMGAYEREDANNRISTGHWFEYGRVLRQTSLIMEPADGRIPALTAEGEARKAQMHSSWGQAEFDSIADFNSLDRCITRGLPASMIPFPYNNGVEVFQAPGYVVLNLEMIHETRIVPLDGRPAIPGAMETWLGSSVGRWEGDTLVIETTNFNGDSPMVIVGPSNEPIPTSEALHVVEHLTLTGPDTMHYEAWIEDPVVLTGGFKLDFPWRRNEEYGVYEYACHEGNTVVPNYIISTSPRFANGELGMSAEQWIAQNIPQMDSGG